MAQHQAHVHPLSQYQSSQIRNLRHCVSDFNIILDYLKSTFNVVDTTALDPGGLTPSPSIVTLTEQAATRSAILSTFKTHLIDNRHIKPDDPIVFYFAGHGTRVKGPQGWETNSSD
ncbi:hypothetical protein FA15DRAFT_698436, partial [Coprinopsis marcescibilis]